MPDSTSTVAERRLQRRFSRGTLFPAIALFATVLLANEAFGWLPNREPRADAEAELVLTPVRLDGAALGPPLRWVGAWAVESTDPRFGGISSLAWDGDALVALTDSGAVVRFPIPQAGTGRAEFRDLPRGPVSPLYKRYRDSEALVPRADGRGWWVAFENRHSLWSYDPTFRFARSRRSLPSRDWSANRGIEALAATGDALLMLHESGNSLLRLEQGRIRERPLRGTGGSATDAEVLPDGRILLSLRNLGFGGFRNRLGWLKRRGDAYEVVELTELPLGPLDNVEALAAQPLRDGGMRLWLMTDNDFSPWRRTLLIAIDLPPLR